ncbi:uncharacterized protein LOC135810053 [Sycon ciliatum]|uniref:uncharacterized protein LOC135810053 n=1 Tax=Sycon ciliatum TaxID=27933 RepID=UPI0031F62F87
MDKNSDSIRRRIGQALFPHGGERSSLPRLVKRPKKKPPSQFHSADLVVSKNAISSESRCAQDLGSSVSIAALEAAKAELGISSLEEVASGSLSITLDRAHVFRDYLAKLQAPGKVFGCRQGRGTCSASSTEQSLVVNVSALWLVPVHAACLSVDQLRVVLATQHLSSVVQTQGLQPIIVADALSCSRDLVQAAIVLACTEKTSGVLSNRLWQYTRESTERLCSVCSHITSDRKLQLDEAAKPILQSVDQCLDPTAKMFPETVVRLIKSLFQTSAVNYSLSSSVPLLRELQSVPELWSALVFIRRHAIESCSSLFTSLSLRVSIIDSLPLLLQSSLDVSSVPYCRIRAGTACVLSTAGDTGLRDGARQPATAAATSDSTASASPSCLIDALYTCHTVEVVATHSQPSCACVTCPLEESRIQPRLVHEEGGDGVVGACSLDVKACLAQHSLPIGKNGFDHGTDYVRCRDMNGTILSPAAVHALHSVELRNMLQCPMIQVVSSSQKIFLQRSDLLAHAFISARPAATVPDMRLNSYHLAVSNVEDSSKTQLTCHQLFQAYHSQMMSAAVCRLGRTADNSYIQRSAMAMTISTVTFQLLTPPLNHVVKTRVQNSQAASSEGGVQDSKEGAFAMYNYARLHTLFANFEKAVAAGTYPPLPALDEIDFTLLTDEAEWQLLLTGVAGYADCLLEVFPGDDMYTALQCADGLYVQCSLNKVCVFLASFCRDLSSYYSRVHVLEEPSPHRFPVIFARLYLLQACQKVLANALGLLKIETFGVL